MVFLLRVRAHSGMKRLVFSSDTATWLSVQQQVADVCGVRIDHQLLSRQPLHQAEYIEAEDNTTIKQLNLHNGDILYLAGEESPATTAPATPTTTPASTSLSAASVATPPHIPPHKLTPDCKHNERGACAYCIPNKPGAPIPPPACQHGPSTVCIHCSAYIKQHSKAKDAPATWLCNHPDSAFCIKCMPPSTDTPKVVKIDKVPFARWLDERKGLCKFKHGANVTCAYCAPPPFPSFAAKVPCDKGHAPYPAAVCLSCAPPNANLRVQPYRHVDSISVESKLLSPFYSTWLRSASPAPKDERAAILIGRYIPEPAETNNPLAIRAQVHALYEPPQQSIPGGVQFGKDDRERLVHEVAKRLGMEAVGWVVAVPAREGGEKYGGKILLSGAEVEQAARFQLRYAANTGYSRFVTLLLEHAQQVEPVAFQVADMAVALEKEKAFTAASSDPYFLATKRVKAGEMTSTIIYKDRPLRGGEEFLPDELLVKVMVSAPRASQTVFAHCEYPGGRAGGESEMVVKQWLVEYKDEEYEEKLNDFNCLVCLCKVVGEDIVYAICEALREKRKLSADLRSQLDSALLAKNLL